MYMCRWKRGYKNVIGKGIELNKAGTDTPLMMETRSAQKYAGALRCAVLRCAALRCAALCCAVLCTHMFPAAVSTLNGVPHCSHVQQGCTHARYNTTG